MKVHLQCPGCDHWQKVDIVPVTYVKDGKTVVADRQFTATFPDHASKIIDTAATGDKLDGSMDWSVRYDVQLRKLCKWSSAEMEVTRR